VPNIFCPTVVKYGFYRQVFAKIFDIKLHGNSSSGNRDDTWRIGGSTDRRPDGWTDMTKTVGALGDFENALKSSLGQTSLMTPSVPSNVLVY
jgi:hypothetical protein